MAQGTTKGVPIDTDPLLAANSDLLVPSQKAVKSYINSTLNSERRNDWVAPYSYCGTAPNGLAESASVWTIYRIQVASDGTVTTLSATNVAWTDRLIVIYT